MNEKEQKPKKSDENVHFDMYHFFSRKDVILAGIVIFALLVYSLFKIFGKTSII